MSKAAILIAASASLFAAALLPKIGVPTELSRLLAVAGLVLLIAGLIVGLWPADWWNERRRRRWCRRECRRIGSELHRICDRYTEEEFKKARADYRVVCGDPLLLLSGRLKTHYRLWMSDRWVRKPQSIDELRKLAEQLDRFADGRLSWRKFRK
jgi:hypothetical protein